MKIVMSSELERCFQMNPIELLKLENEIWKYRNLDEDSKLDIFKIEFSFGEVYVSPINDVFYLLEDKKE